MSTSTPNEKPYVRLATIAEVEVLSEIAVRAFIHDPVINYVNNVDHVSVGQSWTVKLLTRNLASRR